jgi:hypothetical protein
MPGPAQLKNSLPGNLPSRNLKQKGAGWRNGRKETSAGERRARRTPFRHLPFRPMKFARRVASRGENSFYLAEPAGRGDSGNVTFDGEDAMEQLVHDTHEKRRDFRVP